MFNYFKNLINMEISVLFLQFLSKFEIIAKLEVLKNEEL